MTQTRINNIPLFLLFEIQLHILTVLKLSPDEITITSIILQYSSFFAMGGSNAISSIDLSNAYNGISGFNVAAVGFLTFISNWAGAVWWSSAACLLLLQYHDQAPRPPLLLRYLTLCTFFVASNLFFVMLACMLLRVHLFIWTVFSPKFLYSVAWSLGQHLCVNTVITIFFCCGSPGTSL